MDDSEFFRTPPTPPTASLHYQHLSTISIFKSVPIIIDEIHDKFESSVSAFTLWLLKGPYKLPQYPRSGFMFPFKSMQFLMGMKALEENARRIEEVKRDVKKVLARLRSLRSILKEKSRSHLIRTLITLLQYRLSDSEGDVQYLKAYLRILDLGIFKSGWLARKNPSWKEKSTHLIIE